MAKKINEATSSDLPVIPKLVNEYGRKVGETRLVTVVLGFNFI